MPAARLAQVLAQQLAGLRIEEPHVHAVPLHLDALADPAGRRAVVRGVDFDAAVEMHGALAVPVVAKRLDGQRRRCGCSSANIAATCRFVVPWMRVSAQCVSQRSRYACASSSALEAQPCERRLLRVADAGFDLALAIGIADATRQRDDAVVREHVAIERIERRVVDVGREHALAQIVEHDDARRRRRVGERRARAAPPRRATTTARPAAAPTCGCSRASGRRAACGGTCRSRGRGPSAPRRSRPAPPRRAPS